MERTLTVSWNKCEGDKWCPLLTVNLNHPVFEGLRGVYIIWHGGAKPWTVYVGQGEIRSRLTAHRSDKDILLHNPYGLFVTWAQVDTNSRDGVERFLAEQLRPKVGSSHPQTPPIRVNLPW